MYLKQWVFVSFLIIYSDGSPTVSLEIEDPGLLFCVSRDYFWVPDWGAVTETTVSKEVIWRRQSQSQSFAQAGAGVP